MGFVVAAVTVHVAVWLMLFTLARFEPPSAPVHQRPPVTDLSTRRPSDVRREESADAA